MLQWSLSNETVWKSSSSSTFRSYMVRMHLECGCCEDSTGLCCVAGWESDGMSTVELSSSEVLKVNQHQTGLSW